MLKAIQIVSVVVVVGGFTGLTDLTGLAGLTWKRLSDALAPLSQLFPDFMQFQPLVLFGPHRKACLLREY